MYFSFYLILTARSTSRTSLDPTRIRSFASHSRNLWSPWHRSFFGARSNFKHRVIINEGSTNKCTLSTGMSMTNVAETMTTIWNGALTWHVTRSLTSRVGGPSGHRGAEIERAWLGEQNGDGTNGERDRSGTVRTALPRSYIERGEHASRTGTTSRQQARTILKLVLTLP